MRGTCGPWMLSFQLACSLPLVPSRSFLPFHTFQVLSILSFPFFVFLLTSECRRRGATGRRLGSGRGGHARDRAGSQRLPPQRPARALPRPDPHASISEEPLGDVCVFFFFLTRCPCRQRRFYKLYPNLSPTPKSQTGARHWEV